MGSARDMLSRIRGVTGTRKVTRVMKMIASTRLYRAEQQARRGRPYLAGLEELLGELVPMIDPVLVPLLQKRPPGKILVVLFTSDRGLCGAYNTNLFRLREARLPYFEDQEIEYITIGKKGTKYITRGSKAVRKSYINLPAYPGAELTQELSRELLDSFLSKEFSRVFLLYNQYLSKGSFPPAMMQFLPVDIAEISARLKLKPIDEQLYLFERSKEAVFNYVLPLYLNGMIHQVFWDLTAGEQASRLNAMSQATKNADSLIRRLTLIYHQRRQMAITTELLEVVAGAEALNTG